jgi:hypothetical protein
MAKFHKPGESVEGLEISGNSRDPIRYLRSVKLNEKTCNMYKAEFNVSATVGIGLTNEKKFIDTAFTDTGDSISCQSAIIINAGKLNRYNEGLKSNATATHGTNEWLFKKQTNAKIITPRDDVVKAIEKRKEFEGKSIVVI